MSSWHPSGLAIGLWVVATVGAGLVLLGPLTPWVLPAVAVGLLLCLTATAALVVAFLRG